MSGCLSADEVLGFVASDSSEEEIKRLGMDLYWRWRSRQGRNIFMWFIFWRRNGWPTTFLCFCKLLYLVSKTETWQTTPLARNAGRAAVHNVIWQSPGPKRLAKSQCSEVSDTFTLFLRSSLRKTICQWTDHEGAIVHGSSWKPADDEEFEVFLDVYKSNNESVAQLWSILDGCPIFNLTMSRGRYQHILRVLRIDNAQSWWHHRSPDKLQPIREVFETWDSYLGDSYTCGPSMTVDVQLVCLTERCPFKQYIPSKPGKYGSKIWTICDSTCSYGWKM